MNALVKPITWIFGIVFLLIGVAGFFMSSPLLGLYAVDTNHNVVHLLSGIVALIAAGSGDMYARWYLILFGIVYALVTILGFMEGTGTVLGLITVNPADNYLHAAIAAVALVIGFGSAAGASRSY
jgi:hypothetical protein